MDLCWQITSLPFNILSILVITFLPRSKRLLISCLHSPSATILEPIKIKSATVCTVSPSICYEVMGPDAMILVFWILSFKPTFSLSSFRMGENNSKWSNWQTTNLKNIQVGHAAQFQKNKRPIKKWAKELKSILRKIKKESEKLA